MDDMKYALKGIKYAAFASQETPCYRASITRDGKKIGEVSNDGHGGSDMFSFTGGNRGDEASAFQKFCLDWYEARPESKGEISSSLDGAYRYMAAMESWAGSQLDAFLNARAMKRMIAKSKMRGPFYRFVGDDVGTWRGLTRPAPTMSLSMMRIAVENWNTKDGGKRVLAEFINDGKHIKL